MRAYSMLVRGRNSDHGVTTYSSTQQSQSFVRIEIQTSIPMHCQKAQHAARALYLQTFIWATILHWFRSRAFWVKCTPTADLGPMHTRAFSRTQLGLKMFMECSAKTGENVDAAFIELARMVKHRLIDSNPDYSSGKWALQLHAQPHVGSRFEGGFAA